MRQRDERPLDPEVVATLDAIDAALDGQAVDPRQAEVVELALLLRGERPRMDAGFAARLDQRVQRRFEPAPKGAARTKRRWGRRWLWAPATGLATALVVAVVIVGAGGGAGKPSGSTAAVKRPLARQTGSSAVANSASVLHHASAVMPAPAQSDRRIGVQAATSSAFGPSQPLGPFPNGRKIIQSAQLSLSTPPRLVEQVSQEVFNTVGQAHGIVKQSTVTATGGPGGYAQFQLSLPSPALPQTMASLSTLPHARVLSRTDATQDVNDSYQADQRRLGDARALRASLLKQLAAAVTQGQIDSLTARIHDAESAISSDQATLGSLQHQIAYSQVTLTINSGAVPVPTTGSGGFTLGRAAHDAGRVLTVAAGVVLIGLAALLPVGLLVALFWWIGARVRHRRRLQALDLI
jgi:hypothetical protein